jgi:hypothetical protein
MYSRAQQFGEYNLATETDEDSHVTVMRLQRNVNRSDVGAVHLTMCQRAASAEETLMIPVPALHPRHTVTADRSFISFSHCLAHLR